jgi:uncharacterized repeat protein (TIGR03806 family)
MMYRLLVCIGLMGASVLILAHQKPVAPPHQHLSEYGFFQKPLADLLPAKGVFPYEVNAPLFSDYAEKARFIYLPDDRSMTYQSEREFDFPVGAVIIKNFYYYHDASRPENGRKILETRLLIKEEKSWKALEYLWNEDQTDAVLEVAGASFPVSWQDAQGNKQQISYIAPNLNQCKGCHSYDGQFVPIGITARQLNRDNQLAIWAERGQLTLPPDFKSENAPRLADYRRADGGFERYPNVQCNAPDALTARARAYLDANCGHCHNPHGPASTSGMFLHIRETNDERLGVGKAPVAAGRGSGHRKYGIVPGKPDQSILLYRMEQDDPGIRMPELGRQLMHNEGVALIRDWIKSLKK